MRDPNDPEPRPLRAAQIAAMFGVSVQRVYAMDGQLRPTRTGTNRYARREYDRGIVELVLAERMRRAR